MYKKKHLVDDRQHTRKSLQFRGYRAYFEGKKKPLQRVNGHAVYYLQGDFFYTFVFGGTGPILGVKLSADGK
jgi:hypothetical protein